jgi:hypothetical protein
MTYQLQIYKWNSSYFKLVSDLKYDISIAYKTIIHIAARQNICSKMWKILLISWKPKISTTVCSSFDEKKFEIFWKIFAFHYFEFHKNHLWKNYSSYKDCRKNKLKPKDSSNTFLKTGCIIMPILCIVFKQLIFWEILAKILKKRKK